MLNKIGPMTDPCGTKMNSTPVRKMHLTGHTGSSQKPFILLLTDSLIYNFLYTEYHPF